MILEDRDVNEDICFEKKFMYLGALQLHSSRYGYLMVVAFRVARNNFCSGAFSSFSMPEVL